MTIYNKAEQAKQYHCTLIYGKFGGDGIFVSRLVIPKIEISSIWTHWCYNHNHVYSNGSREGAGGSSPPPTPTLIFRPNWGPKGQKKVFQNFLGDWLHHLSQGLDDCAPEVPTTTDFEHTPSTMTLCDLLVSPDLIHTRVLPRMP